MPSNSHSRVVSFSLGISINERWIYGDTETQAVSAEVTVDSREGNLTKGKVNNSKP